MGYPIGFLLANASRAAADADDLAAELGAVRAELRSARMTLAGAKRQRDALRADLRQKSPNHPLLAQQNALFDEGAAGAGVREGLTPREIDAWLRAST
ncbi:hypothetical protein E2C06_35900 [Dankookia rubra]|uniref:Uncharacterized protein n=1 Tax=Dankookia rubra TaxID=1442381 RepID=A0A4R5Q536_9PROT|nr:hypothetical protein [Dankookia rubra]TDH57428.1 hypothetical protein E2C06_35900 [Dankookia rubra]